MESNSRDFIKTASAACLLGSDSLGLFVTIIENILLNLKILKNF